MRRKKIVEIEGVVGVFTELGGAYGTGGWLGILFTVGILCTGGEASWVVLFTLSELYTRELVTVGT